MINNNNRRRNFRPRPQKNNFRRRNGSASSNSGGGFNNNGNLNFNRNGSMTNPHNVEKTIQKFQQLAKDAQSSGDPVLVENYLQHADHYARRLAELNERNKVNTSIEKTSVTSTAEKSENISKDTSATEVKLKDLS
jgi:hypothetical protein|tara:strand:- start:124 stop:531 length:408 start_codon:yes stop_codon:yes gene_type:complete